MLHRNIPLFARSRKCLILVFFLFQCCQIQAQQDWNYSQYLFNLYDINSAYAGNHNSPSFALRHRSQWIGLDGAPSTQQISFHLPLANGKIGCGTRIMNESIGARNQQMAKLSFAYKLKLGSGMLSLAIAGGALRQGLNRDKLTAPDLQDAQMINLANSTVTPVADAAVFFNTKKFYAGVEAGRLNRSAYNYSANSLARLYYNMSLVTGYMHQLGADNMIQVSALMKYSEGKLWQSEINVLYLHHNKFWIGAGYRVMCGIQGFACFNINEHFRLGLSYDMATSALQNANDGSAELFLGYTLKNRSGKSVRYF